MARTILLLVLITAAEAFLGRLWIKRRKPKKTDGNQPIGEVFPNGTSSDGEEEQSMFFYSINISVVVEEKSWEEALEHCRGINSDLSSLHSDTENMAALKDNMAAPITDRAWIGLRFLGDRWLWVNGDPLEYQAWSDGGDQQCPMQNRCGALNKGGLWENRDCEERLNFICSSYV